VRTDNLVWNRKFLLVSICLGLIFGAYFYGKSWQESPPDSKVSESSAQNRLLTSPQLADVPTTAPTPPPIPGLSPFVTPPSEDKQDSQKGSGAEDQSSMAGQKSMKSETQKPLGEKTHFPEYFNAPALKTYREEVEKNPHVTPPSLLSFSEKIAENEILVKKGLISAQEFSASLRNCVVLGFSQIPRSARALCLQYHIAFMSNNRDSMGKNRKTTHEDRILSAEDAPDFEILGKLVKGFGGSAEK
jgi:hypothetical protein